MNEMILYLPFVQVHWNAAFHINLSSTALTHKDIYTVESECWSGHFSGTQENFGEDEGLVQRTTGEVMILPRLGLRAITL